MKALRIKDLDDDLRAGDIVRNLGSGQTYIIIEKSKGLIIGARTVEITNSSEWEKIISE